MCGLWSYAVLGRSLTDGAGEVTQMGAGVSATSRRQWEEVVLGPLCDVTIDDAHPMQLG